MARVLIIDDDRIIRKIVESTLSKMGYEVIEAGSGKEGLKMVETGKPDVIVTDKLMPDIDGIELTRQLRGQQATANIPILVLTGESDLEDKVNAFEAGADDYLAKPFEAAELAARVMVLMRRAESLKAMQEVRTSKSNTTKLIVVHSLRGGIGSTSFAVNLALALNNLWQQPTVLTDMVLFAGQVALMLNSPAKFTWGDIVDYSSDELDIDVIDSIMGRHDSGLRFISAPTNPASAEQLNNEKINKALSLLKSQHDYVVADLAHDFSDITLDLLDEADNIILMLAPEMASVRTAAIALDTYSRLGYEPKGIKLVLNWTFERDGLPSRKIEQALNHPISLVLPFAAKQFVGAINRGVPILHGSPENAISSLIEDFAFNLSKESHKETQPENPSAAWQRINNRLNLFSNRQPQKKLSSILSLG